MLFRSRFTLAVDKNLNKDKKMELESRNQPTADFINVTVWGKQAENCVIYLSKGRLVAISGRIQTGSYEKDGERKYTTEVVAERVQFLQFVDANKSDIKDDYTPSQTTIEGIPAGFYEVNNADIPF